MADTLPKLPTQINTPSGAPQDVRGVALFLTQFAIRLNAWVAQVANLINTLIIPAILDLAGTVKEVDTGTGLTGGPITVTGTVSLANTAVTPASYTSANITVDQQGRITAASSGGTGGTVTSVTAGTGLTGGTITTTGTIAIDTGVVAEYSGTLTTGQVILGDGSNVVTASGVWGQVSGTLTGNLNTTAAPGALSGATGIYFSAADGDTASVLLDSYGNNSSLFFRAAGGTNMTPTALSSGAAIMNLAGQGYTGAAYSGSQGTCILGAAEAWTATTKGTSWRWSTTVIGGTGVGQRMRLQADGTLYIGGTNSETSPNTGAGTVNTTNGYFRGGSSSPTNIQTGKAATQKTTASPGAVTATSPTYKMLGFAGTITPKWNTVALVTFTGQCNSGTLADVATLVLSYGTGSAPTNGAALAGTQVGSVYTFTQAVASDVTGFTLTAVITGLTAGTAYWLDLAVGSSGGHAITFGSTGCSAIEP